MNRPAAFDSQITFLYTDDMAASVRFYEDVLGFRLWLDQTTCRIYQVAGGAFVGVCQTGQGEAQQRGPQANVIVTLVTDAVDAWYTHLVAQGVMFEKAPSLNERYGIYNCFFRDPNGYLFEIQRFLNPPTDP